MLDATLDYLPSSFRKSYGCYFNNCKILSFCLVFVAVVQVLTYIITYLNKQLIEVQVKEKTEKVERRCTQRDVPLPTTLFQCISTLYISKIILELVGIHTTWWKCCTLMQQTKTVFLLAYCYILGLTGFKLF